MGMNGPPPVSGKNGRLEFGGKLMATVTQWNVNPRPMGWELVLKTGERLAVTHVDMPYSPSPAEYYSFDAPISTTRHASRSATVTIRGSSDMPRCLQPGTRCCLRRCGGEGEMPAVVSQIDCEPDPFNPETWTVRAQLQEIGTTKGVSPMKKAAAAAAAALKEQLQKVVEAHTKGLPVDPVIPQPASTLPNAPRPKTYERPKRRVKLDI